MVWSLDQMGGSLNGVMSSLVMQWVMVCWDLNNEELTLEMWLESEKNWKSEKMEPVSQWTECKNGVMELVMVRGGGGSGVGRWCEVAGVVVVEWWDGVGDNGVGERIGVSETTIGEHDA